MDLQKENTERINKYLPDFNNYLESPEFSEDLIRRSEREA